MDSIVNKRIVALGHSHLIAIAKAYALFYGDQPGRAPFDVEFLQFHDEVYQPNVAPEFPDRSWLGRFRRYWRPPQRKKGWRHNRKLHPAIERQVERLVRRQKTDLIASCAMGNEYNAIAMLNHPRRFDFYLPGRPDLPTDETAEVLPVDLIEDLLHARLGKKLALYLDMISKQKGAAKIHIPPPPPIRHTDHIRAYPGVFRRRMEKFGVSPPFFRLKMWILTCDVQRKLCDARGIVLYRLPEAIFDSDGFRAERFWGHDPTHGNEAYGKAILDSIAATNFAAEITEPGRERAPVRKLAEPPFVAARS